jgi:hypothetical protein
MIFASPAWLFALLALPVLLALEAWLSRRDRDRLSRLVSRPLWARVVRGPSGRWRLARLALLTLGAAAYRSRSRPAIPSPAPWPRRRCSPT